MLIKGLFFSDFLNTSSRCKTWLTFVMAQLTSSVPFTITIVGATCTLLISSVSTVSRFTFNPSFDKFLYAFCGSPCNCNQPQLTSQDVMTISQVQFVILLNEPPLRTYVLHLFYVFIVQSAVCFHFSFSI